MEFTETTRDDYTVIVLRGRLDAHSALKFEQSAVKLLDQGKRKVVVDLGEVDYINSKGLRAFLVLGKKLNQTHGKLGLCGVRKAVRFVFEVAGCDSLFNFFPSPDEAIKALG